jgi:hypothetical protein
MTIDDDEDDLLAAVASLRRCDVSQRRARDLRARCHAALAPRPRQMRSARLMKETVFRRIIGPALGGAWSLAYLMEMIRHAAAMYGLQP